jgi:nucleoside 2-deoxyribosyltransferase
MEMVKIYLAGACYFEEDEGRGWREKASQMIETATADKEVKVKVINPVDFFNYSEAKHQSDTQVKRYYMDQILNSRLVLVNLDRSRTSPGTAQELQFAVDHNIPVVGFGTEDIYPWLKVDCQCVFTSLLQAIDYITDYYCS